MSVMLVADVIKALQRKDPAAVVVVDGYEEGFADDIEVCDVYLERNLHGEKDGLYGKHGRPYGDATKPEKGWNMKAVLIGEGRHLSAGW